jgi:hypothetical protein
LTALRALKIAQRRLRPEVRARLLAISSARSDTAFLPPAWRFTFADAATSGNSRMVTVAAKTSSEHPDVVEAFSGADREDVSCLAAIPQNKLLVDSDKALENIRTSSKLKGARGVEFRLVQVKRRPEPTWSVRIFGETGDLLASFRVGAKSGAVESGVDAD